ncbi:MAG TPA: helix-turn-helix domain-containing protein [Gammaproteobacteria bacterium]
MGRRRQVSDLQITEAAREVFLQNGPKAPVALVAKKLGVSTATLFQRAGSKTQLMLMALVQSAPSPTTELQRGVQTEVPVRQQLGRVLFELNEYLGTVISGSLTLRAARIEAELPEPRPSTLRRLLTRWLEDAAAASLLDVRDAKTTADVLIGTLESRHIHAYMQQQTYSARQHRDYIRSLIDVVFPPQAGA